MKELTVEEAQPVTKKGFFISTKIAILIVAVTAAVFIGSILATYFGTVSTNESKTTVLVNDQTTTVNGRTTTLNEQTTARTTEPTTTVTTAEPINYRLPSDLYPHHYHLTVKPLFALTEQPKDYDVEISIEIECINNTNKLVMHMRNLTLDNSSLSIKSDTDSGFSYNGFSWNYDSVTEKFTAEFTQEFKQGHVYRFSCKFKGYLDRAGLGFYYSSYTDTDGIERFYLTSQMEPVDARKAFICFDEPNYKSNYTITAIHHKSLDMPLSNMPVKLSQPHETDWIKTEFETSVKMSSYLVALVISDFRCKENTVDLKIGKVSSNVCAKQKNRQLNDELELANEYAVKLLIELEKYYNVAYPLPKLDHVGIFDYIYGAMENWGLCTYRESYFLYTEGLSSITTELNVISILAHEICHQWFGNLVTPKWWNDLWLNEGFARYMEHLGTDLVRKDMRMFDRLLDLLIGVSQADASNTTRQINLEVNTNEEITGNIDGTITYGKGSSVVRLTSYVLNQETFDKGLTRYFNLHKYSNVEQDDLWNELHQTAKDDGRLLDIDLTAYMRTWTDQRGHPVLNIRKIDSNTISVTQNRFVLDSTHPLSELDDTLWSIPFSHSVEKLGSSDSFVRTVDSSNLYSHISWIDRKKEQTLTLSKPLDDDSFLLINLDMAGFYRVNYPRDNWEKISKQLLTNKESIPPRTRAQLINDAFALSQATYIDAEITLELIKYLENEFDYLPWKIFIDRIRYTIDLLDSSESSNEIQSYLAKLVEPYYTKLGWEEDLKQDWTDRWVRNRIVTFACQRDVQHCVKKSLDYFNGWMNDRNNVNRIPSSYQSLVYCTSLRQGSKKEFDFLYNEYKKANSSVYISSLTCTKDESLLTRLLSEQRLSGNIISILRNIATKPFTYKLAWNFLKANWDILYPKYGSQLYGVLNDLGTKFKTEYELEEMKFFLASKNVPGLESTIASVEKRVSANIKWYSRNQASVYQTLEELLADEDNEIDYRLPRNIIPEHYDLEVKPFIGPRNFPLNDTFEGKINMHILCAIPTNKVIFHAKELNINVVGFEQVDNIDDFDTRNKIDANKRIDTDDEREFIIVTLNRECKQGTRYILKLEYSGIIIDKLYGFYRSSYLNSAQERKYLATTKFEPVDARRAFPCFDEPNLKASYKITIIREKDMNSYSNNPKMNTEDIPGEVNWQKDYYDTTVKMSSYLAAFVISDFKMIEKNSSIHNINVQVVARPEAIDNGSGDYALEVAAAILDFFVDYFDVQYPLSKSTQIAIPDFNSGAMENWGLVTYRESSLLYNPNTDTSANKKRVAEVISHELAHQWFGNLVTMDWWNDLWLNEGFASWVEYLGIDEIHKEWRPLDYFFVDTTLAVLVKDSYETSHPINVEVKNPREIGSLFDSISYDKGSSILRMMNSFLTEKTFKAGVSNYLKINSFGNAVQDQLWNELTKQGHKDGTLDLTLSIEEIMNNWTKIKGYPVVNVHRVNNKIEVTQEYFLLNPQSQIINDKQEYNKYKWYIPFNFKTKNEAGFDVFKRPTWFKPTDTKLTIDLNAGVSSDSWIIANIEHSGFYRVNYDSKNWELIIAQLKTQFSDFSSITRAQLLDDSFNLGRADKLDQTFFLGIVEYLKSETDPMAFRSAFYGLNYISDMLETEIFIFNKYKKFYLDLLIPSYNRLGWNETLDDVNEINTQTSVLQTVCSLGYKDCIDKARDYYKNIDNDNNPIPNNFKNVVYRTVIKYGTDDDWLSLYDRALRTTDQAEKLRYLRSLTYTQSYALLKFILSKSSDTEVVRSQDETTIIADVANNVIGRRLAFDYVDENWDYFFEKYSRVSFTLPNLVTRTFQLLNTRQDLNNLKEFKIRHPILGIATNAFNEVMEIVNTNTLWTEKNFALINEWLSQNN